jgi:hypothetical protein
MRYESSIFGVIFIFLCSCAGTNRGPSPYHGLSDSEQIYSLVFDLVLGPDSLRRAYTIIDDQSRAFKAARILKDQALYRRATDSILRLPDSIVLKVRVCDTTTGESFPERNFLNKVEYSKTRDRYYHNEQIQDTVFLRLLREYNSQLAQSRPFDLNLIRSMYPYRLICSSTYKHNMTPIIPHSIRFSRIAFSTDSSKAVVGTGFWCGSLCASEEIWFLIKERGDWYFYASMGGSTC